MTFQKSCCELHNTDQHVAWQMFPSYTQGTVVAQKRLYHNSMKFEGKNDEKTWQLLIRQAENINNQDNIKAQ